ncbi:hypothetical protein JCM1840_006846 [Sporobolomyces johnsonii]
MSDDEATALFHRRPTAISSGSTGDVSSDSEGSSDESAHPPAKCQVRPTAKAVAGTETRFFESSSPRPLLVPATHSRWDFPIFKKNPAWNSHYIPDAPAQVLDFAEKPRTDVKLPCDSPPRYSYYKRRLHSSGVLDLKMELATKRDHRVRAQKKAEASLRKEAEAAEAARTQERLEQLRRDKVRIEEEAARLSGRQNGGKPERKAKGQRAETVIGDSQSELDDEDGNVPDARARSLRVVDFICNAGGNGDDGEHSPESHFKYFFANQKKMWPELVRYCAGRGFTLNAEQAKGIWRRQLATYKKCKNADETTGGAPGDNAEISEEAKATFEATQIYEWIDKVVAYAPNVTRELVLNQNGRSRRAGTAFGSDDDSTRAQVRRANRKRRESDQEQKAALELAQAARDEAAEKRFNDRLEDMNKTARDGILSQERIAALQMIAADPNAPADLKIDAYAAMRDAVRCRVEE